MIIELTFKANSFYSASYIKRAVGQKDYFKFPERVREALRISSMTYTYNSREAIKWL